MSNVVSFYYVSMSARKLHSNPSAIGIGIRTAKIKKRENKMFALTLLFCRNSSACSHKLSHRSNRPLSAHTAPRNTIGCATSGHFVVKIRSRIVNDSMWIELWLNRIACKSWMVWLSIQFSYAGTGAIFFLRITFSGSSYLCEMTAKPKNKKIDCISKWERNKFANMIPTLIP